MSKESDEIIRAFRAGEIGERQTEWRLRRMLWEIRLRTVWIRLDNLQLRIQIMGRKLLNMIVRGMYISLMLIRR